MRGVGEFTSFINRISELERKCAAMRSALEFYADGRRYEGPNLRPLESDPYAKPDDVYIRDVTRDRGEIAMKALKVAE